ncbi:hypothetical protein K432DRAFT_453341 [Lepidopterella palustris CBS 459.81]|uniref:Uncharacterized protein n=1 Tax=Lepidopterella palustris CBS 459.81 TaxID=1314670 RepID=A0A8E2EAJ9_9PEZI|nr:hypothetical protein K432DRAFT_453341 [Lepidopterella palustris CBS 459.81]
MDVTVFNLIPLELLAAVWNIRGTLAPLQITIGSPFFTIYRSKPMCLLVLNRRRLVATVISEQKFISGHAKRSVFAMSMPIFAIDGRASTELVHFRYFEVGRLRNLERAVSSNRQNPALAVSNPPDNLSAANFRQYASRTSSPVWTHFVPDRAGDIFSHSLKTTCSFGMRLILPIKERPSSPSWP